MLTLSLSKVGNADVSTSIVVLLQLAKVSTLNLMGLPEKPVGSAFPGDLQPAEPPQR